MEEEDRPPPSAEPLAESPDDAAEATDEEQTDEEKAQARARVTANLRKLIAYVCDQRLGGVPPDLAAVLQQEENLLMLSRWYIGAATLSVADLVTLVHAPRPDP